MKSRFLIFVVLIVCVVCVAGCELLELLGLGGDPNAGQLAVLDIVGARALFIAPGVASASRFMPMATGDSATLFKITDDGVVVEVTASDENGNAVTSNLLPTAIADAGPDYILVKFEYVQDFDVPAFLVRKTDGAVFSLDGVGWPRIYGGYVGIPGGFKNGPSVQTDQEGSIYYLSGLAAAETIVKKLDVSDPGNITAINWTPDTDAPGFFMISPEGHCAYDGRLKKANGGLYNLPDGVIWLGIGGEFKYQDPNTDCNEIVTIHIDDLFNVTTTSVTGTDLPSLGWTPNGYIFRFGERTVIVGDGTVNLVEVENPSDTPRVVTISGIDEISMAAGSSTSYYLAGYDASNNPLLLKIDPETDSATTLLPQGGADYDVYKMVVSDDDIVTFNALRMSDGVKVLGEIDATGVLDIIDEDLNVTVTSLERVQ